MRQNNLELWDYQPSLHCLLFFAQRMDELLFHHTIDSYRYLALSLRTLSDEYCTVYKDVQNGTINKKNLEHIIDELSYRLQNDDIAKTILTHEFVERFNKKYNNWDSKTQFENVRYISRKLSNRAYYNLLVKELKLLIMENKQKKKIDTLTALFARELLDCGYSKDFIFRKLHNIFFHNKISSHECLDDFFNSFDFAEKSYTVYIGYSDDMSFLLPLFEKLKASNLKISIVTPDNVPKGIKTKRQKTILKFEKIKSYDMYSAFEIADVISSWVINSYSFFRHYPDSVHTYSQVVDENNLVTTINVKKLLKDRVPMLSREDSTKNAETLLRMLFTNYENLLDFFTITKIHNAAISASNTSDSLLSLWSILESIVEEDGNDDKISTNNNEKKERSKIGNVIAYTLPYLKSTYIQKLVQTCMSDIIRWNEEFFYEHIANNGFGTNNLEHTFAFLAFKTMQTQRDELYALTEQYPLLRHRVCTLSNSLLNSQGIKAIIKNHSQRVEWHLYRIYRARNYIIHDANENNHLNEELVINLHSYVDILFSEVISLIETSPCNNSIHDAITGHKLSVEIMDEKLANRANEDITEENALQYFYYDFER